MMPEHDRRNTDEWRGGVKADLLHIKDAVGRIDEHLDRLNSRTGINEKKISNIDTAYKTVSALIMLALVALTIFSLMPK